MSLAGHGSKLYLTTTSGATPAGGDEVDGANQTALDMVRDELDTTDFADGSSRTFIQGLIGFEIPVSGDYEPSNSAQGRMRTSLLSGTNCWAHLRYDGSAGDKLEVLCTKFRISSNVGEKVTFEATLRATGAIAAS